MRLAGTLALPAWRSPPFTHETDGTSVDRDAGEPPALRCALLQMPQHSSLDDRYREAVVALCADGLDCGRGGAGIGGEGFVKAADALDLLVLCFCVDHFSLAHDVVDDDHGAGA